MVKMLLLIGIVVTALVIGGVLDVSVHPDQVAQVPGRVVAKASNPATQAQAKTLFTRAKRSVEQLAVRDAGKQAKLSLLYIKQDAASLKESLADVNADPVTVTNQAELLKDSLLKAEQKLSGASIETLTALKDDSREAVIKAQEALALLAQQQARYESVQDRLKNATNGIGANLQKLGGDAVAVPEPSTSPEENSEIKAVPVNI